MKKEGMVFAGIVHLSRSENLSVRSRVMKIENYVLKDFFFFFAIFACLDSELQRSETSISMGSCHFLIKQTFRTGQSNSLGHWVWQSEIQTLNSTDALSSDELHLMMRWVATCHSG